MQKSNRIRLLGLAGLLAGLAAWWADPTHVTAAPPTKGQTSSIATGADGKTVTTSGDAATTKAATAGMTDSDPDAAAKDDDADGATKKSAKKSKKAAKKSTTAKTPTQAKKPAAAGGGAKGAGFNPGGGGFGGKPGFAGPATGGFPNANIASPFANGGLGAGYNPNVNAAGSNASNSNASNSNGTGTGANGAGANGGASGSGTGRTTNAAGGRAADVTLTDDLATLIELTNVERTKQGLAALTPDATLMSVARGHSDNQARLNTMAHTLEGVTFFQRIEQAGYRYRAVGENVAAGQRTPAEAVRDWMNSPGHRANILNAQFTQIGVGIAKSATTGMLYYTQNFGTPAN